jgi:hypothetical protein
MVLVSMMVFVMASATWGAAATSASWVIQQTPNDGDHFGSNYLYGVACVNATTCFAVGAYSSSTGDLPITMAWNGSAWSMTNIQSPSGSDIQLNAVSCLSPTDCSAVGSYRPNSRKTRTLIEHWDGAHWSMVTPPDPGTNHAVLNGISCVPAAGTCTAVGDYWNRRRGFTLVERWDGSAWAIVPSPNPAKGGPSLYGVSCSSDSACTAVGIAGKHPLAERWNGSTWSLQVVPKPNGTYPSLVGVSCPSATSCTAVGLYGTPDIPQLPLVESWDGTNWVVQSSPIPPNAPFTFLAGVDCRSSTSCLAVGGSSQSGPDYRTLSEAWDGASWTIQNMPDAGFMSSLAAISCTGAHACTAVGSRDAPPITLAERYS